MCKQLNQNRSKLHVETEVPMIGPTTLRCMGGEDQNALRIDYKEYVQHIW